VKASTEREKEKEREREQKKGRERDRERRRERERDTAFLPNGCSQGKGPLPPILSGVVNRHFCHNLCVQDLDALEVLYMALVSCRGCLSGLRQCLPAGGVLVRSPVPAGLTISVEKVALF
jgi:hypothetical protein